MAASGKEPGFGQASYRQQSRSHGSLLRAAATNTLQLGNEDLGLEAGSGWHMSASTRCAKIKRKNVPDRGNSKHKIPEAEMSLA